MKLYKCGHYQRLVNYPLSKDGMKYGIPEKAVDYRLNAIDLPYILANFANFLQPPFPSFTKVIGD